MVFANALLMLAAFIGAPQPAMRGEFIFIHAPFKHCHAATIVELRNGRGFLAAWYGGSAGGKPDVAIWAAHKSQGKWAAPFVLAREPHIATYNPVLFYSKDGRLWLYYKFGPDSTSWTCGRRYSLDNGKTWSPIEHLPAGLIGPSKDKPLVLGDGTIVSGTSSESYLSWACWVERSTDNGRTWKKEGPIVMAPGYSRPPAFWNGSQAPGVRLSKTNRIYGIIQPTVVQLSDGRLRMFVRSTQRIGRICYADSHDGGFTWTAARPTVLPNPNSGIDSVRLRDGRILMVYDDSTVERTPLKVAISSDGGLTWKALVTLESGPGEYSYPSVIQARNGDVHIVYTWNNTRIKHVVIPSNELQPPT